MKMLQGIARFLVRLGELVDEWGPFVAAVSSDPAIRDALTVELWQTFGEPAMPQLRPLPSSVSSLDVAPFVGSAPLVEMLEARPVDESARRARVLDEYAVLLEPLDEARSRARLGLQEAQLWHLTRYEKCSIGE